MSGASPSAGPDKTGWLEALGRLSRAAAAAAATGESASSLLASALDEKSALSWAESLRRAEEQWRKLAGVCQLQRTAHPTVFYSALPRHWRSNKSLPTPFVVLALQPIPDGTRVTVAAGNDEKPTVDVKNCTAEFTGQMARFTDLRFVGKSGRGKTFNLTITIYTSPVNEVATVSNAIKVTVDGPRDSRNANKISTSGAYGHATRGKRSILSVSPTAAVDGVCAELTDKLARQTAINVGEEISAVPKRRKIAADSFSDGDIDKNSDKCSASGTTDSSGSGFCDRFPMFQWRQRRASKRSPRRHKIKLDASPPQPPATAQTALSLYNTMLASATLSATVRRRQQQQQQLLLQSSGNLLSKKISPKVFSTPADAPNLHSSLAQIFTAAAASALLGRPSSYPTDCPRNAPIAYTSPIAANPLLLYQQLLLAQLQKQQQIENAKEYSKSDWIPQQQDQQQSATVSPEAAARRENDAGLLLALCGVPPAAVTLPSGDPARKSTGRSTNLWRPFDAPLAPT